MSFLWPLPLKKNENIDIIAPAFGYFPDILAKIETFFSSWNLCPLIPDDIFGIDVLCAQNDEIRFNHLYKALHNEKSRYIWCLRGGYGSARLLSLLKDVPAPATPKFLIGSSDITALHIFLNQKWGWPSLHAAPLKTIVMNEISAKSVLCLKDLLLGGQTNKKHDHLVPLNHTACQSQSIHAPIIGGNLTLVESGMGTFWQMDAFGKIIFLEEVDERGYRIDRSLVHLSQAGIFDHAKAIILGDFIGGEEKDGSSLIKPVLQRFADSLSIPVLKMEGIGHGFDDSPLPLGVPIILETGSNPSLTYQL
ncbi:MAG: LD-carboxypeptidase [Alphaproteobacteria bacterium]|nr:LD-carboxypeptidase [Alphaproteobacteria bacterium]